MVYMEAQDQDLRFQVQHYALSSCALTCALLLIIRRRENMVGVNMVLAEFNKLKH